MGARPPRSVNQGTGEQAIGTDTLPLLTPARIPNLTVRDPKRMGAAWQGCSAEWTGEAVSPHPVSMGADASKAAHWPRPVNAPRPHAYLRLGRRA